MNRKSRSSPLGPEQIEKDREVRALIEEEKPQINARILRRMAEIRQAEAAARGGPTLGQRLRSAREARGLSQTSLATAAKISQGYLSQLEQDEREPTLSIASRLAHALDLSLDQLVANVIP